jgi:membrane protease YdiL (CAAX protease family)
MSATCKLQELCNQINSNLPNPSDHTSPLQNKVLTSCNVIFAVPLLEELFFRQFLQGYILKKFSNFVIKNCVSQVKSPMIDKIDKVARVALTAGLFSLCHLNNEGQGSDAQLQGQLVHTFVVGLGLGWLKESEAGLLGAVGAHMANNAIASMEYLMSC